MSFAHCSSLFKFNIKNGYNSAVSKTFCTVNIIMSKRSPNKILTMNRNFKIQDPDPQYHRFNTSYQYDMKHLTEPSFKMMLWRAMCSNTGAKPNENEMKYSLKNEDLDNIRRGMGGKTPFKDDEITKHNLRVLSDMDKKIKENIDALKTEKKLLEGPPKAKPKELPILKESSLDTNYWDMILKYSPVKISSPQEFQMIVSKEFEEFKKSDLNEVPKHIMIIAFAGLVPFVIPLVDVILVHGYTPGMELFQTTYSSLLLTTLGGVHLTSCVQSIINNKVCKEDIPSLIYPFTLSWLSLLTPSVGLVLNSTGLILLFLEDVQKGGTKKPAWYKSLRFFTTTTAVVSMTVMLIGKVIS